MGETRQAGPSEGQRLPGGSLASRTTQELFDLGVQTQRAIKERLLTPDERLLQEHAAFLAQPDTGIVRLLVRIRNGTEGNYDLAMALRGGGAYYDCATREHSYDAEPDLCYQRDDGRGQDDARGVTPDDAEQTRGRMLPSGAFESAFYGIQLGLMVELGDVGLADLPRRSLPLPAWLPRHLGEAWRILWSEITLEDARHDSEFRARTKGLSRMVAYPTAPSTFLLRVFSPGEHDHLVAFRPIARDEGSCTLLWRSLATWPVPGNKRSAGERRYEHREVPEGPRWLARMELPELLALLDAIRAQARPSLFDIPRRVQDRYRSVLGASEAFPEVAGLARILPRFRWDPLVDFWGGGAYFSFLTRSNSYHEHAELELDELGHAYRSGFAGGDQGLFLDLGVIPFHRLAAVVAGERPAGLSRLEEEAWEFLWSVRAVVAEGGRRSLSAADMTRALQLNLSDDVPAIVGHSYLLRSVQFDSHDHLVVFTTVDADEHGHTLAWRILRSWPVEQSQGR